MNRIDLNLSRCASVDYSFPNELIANIEEDFCKLSQDDYNDSRLTRKGTSLINYFKNNLSGLSDYLVARAPPIGSTLGQALKAAISESARLSLIKQLKTGFTKGDEAERRSALVVLEGLMGIPQFGDILKEWLQTESSDAWEAIVTYVGNTILQYELWAMSDAEEFCQGTKEQLRREAYLGCVLEPVAAHLPDDLLKSLYKMLRFHSSSLGRMHLAVEPSQWKRILLPMAKGTPEICLSVGTWAFLVPFQYRLKKIVSELVSLPYPPFLQLQALSSQVYQQDEGLGTELWSLICQELDLDIFLTMYDARQDLSIVPESWQMDALAKSIDQNTLLSRCRSELEKPRISVFVLLFIKHILRGDICTEEDRLRIEKHFSRVSVMQDPATFLILFVMMARDHQPCALDRCFKELYSPVTGGKVALYCDGIYRQNADLGIDFITKIAKSDKLTKDGTFVLMVIMSNPILRRTLMEEISPQLFDELKFLITDLFVPRVSVSPNLEDVRLQLDLQNQRYEQGGKWSAAMTTEQFRTVIDTVLVMAKKQGWSNGKFPDATLKLWEPALRKYLVPERGNPTREAVDKLYYFSWRCNESPIQRIPISALEMAAWLAAVYPTKVNLESFAKYYLDRKLGATWDQSTIAQHRDKQRGGALVDLMAGVSSYKNQFFDEWLNYVKSRPTCLPLLVKGLAKQQFERLIQSVGVKKLQSIRSCLTQEQQDLLDLPIPQEPPRAALTYQQATGTFFNAYHSIYELDHLLQLLQHEPGPELEGVIKWQERLAQGRDYIVRREKMDKLLNSAIYDLSNREILPPPSPELNALE